MALVHARSPIGQPLNPGGQTTVGTEIILSTPVLAAESGGVGRCFTLPRPLARITGKPCFWLSATLQHSSPNCIT